jgi:hypothetical protein
VALSTFGNFLALASFAMTIGNACVKGYPGGVDKPTALKIMIHISIFRLEADSEYFPQTSRRFVIGIGAFSASAKIAECA